MKKIVVISICLVALFMIGFILWGVLASKVEQPKYTVIQSEGSIELRQYEPQLVAQVRVEGERTEAIEKGFRKLADFIFGNNQSNGSISMTAPVQQSGQTISMTAPVQQKEENGIWQIEFIMPSEYTLETLPKPNNKEIKIIERQAYKTVAIQFSGRASQKNLEHHLNQLKTFMENQKLTPLQGPIYAYYNPPWTLPMLRRNEIYFYIEVTP